MRPIFAAKFGLGLLAACPMQAKTAPAHIATWASIRGNARFNGSWR